MTNTRVLFPVLPDVSDKTIMVLSMVFLAAMAVAYSGGAFAGADATFGAAQGTLTTWITGSLGRMVALASMAVGIVMAITQKSLMPLAVAAGIGIAASVGPSVILQMVTATL